MGKSVNDLLNDVGVVGLMKMNVGTGITLREINGEMSQGGGVAKREIASDTAGVNWLLAVFD